MKTRKNINNWAIFPAEQINVGVDLLPKAELVELMPKEYVAEAALMEDFKGVRVRDSAGKVNYVQVSGKDYKLVQHAEAFRPVIEGMTLAGNKDFKFSLNHNFKRAELRLYSGGFGYDGVMLGWKISNSFDGHSRLRYGVEINKGKQYIEIVGYRQACSNGMLVKVPLEDAEIIQPELLQKIQEKVADAEFCFKHTGGVMDSIKTVQYVAEALELLHKPMEAVIKKAGKIKIEDKKKIKQLIKLHVGKRYYSRVKEQFLTENSDLWGLYNAITYVASHHEDLTDSSRDLLLEKAADMLLVELRA